MQPYVPHSNSLPAPTPLVPRSAGDANLQSLLGFLAQQHQQQGGGGSAEGGSSSSAHNGGSLESPIRPEAMRVLSQTLGGPSQGVPGTQQLLAGLAGYAHSTPEANMSAIMQLLGHPYSAEVQRQLISRAGPFTLTTGLHGDAGGAASSGGGRGKSSGSGKRAVTADEDGDGSGAIAVSDEALQLKRIAATQEKNRRNQRKYRERQKAKITTSEQQIKDLTDRVEQLERLNEQLTLRARDLEVANQAAAQNAVLSSNADCMAAARQRDVFQALARFCSQVSGEAVTEEHVRRFTFRDWRKYTQEYQERLLLLLADGSDILDMKARSELASLVSVKHEAERQAWTHMPQPIHKHYAYQARLPPGPALPAVPPPTPADWKAIAELQLSMDQGARLLHTRALVLAQVPALLAERQRIGETLQTAPASLGEGTQALGAHALTAAAMEQLQRNLQREDRLIFTLLHTFWEVATPVQAARADQLCYPHLPDVLAMCAALTDSSDITTNGARPASVHNVKRQKIEPASPPPLDDVSMQLPSLDSLLDAAVFQDGPQGLYAA